MRFLQRVLVVAIATLLGGAIVACGDDQKGAASEKPAATLKGEGFSVRMPGRPKRQVITAQT